MLSDVEVVYGSTYRGASSCGESVLTENAVDSIGAEPAMFVLINITFSDLNHSYISELQCMISACGDVPLSPLPCGYPMGLACAMSWSSNQRHFIA